MSEGNVNLRHDKSISNKLDRCRSDLHPEKESPRVKKPVVKLFHNAYI